MKILLLDIETAPNLAHVWGIWQQNVGINQIMESGYTLSWAAKWYREKTTHFSSLNEASAKAMTKGIHTLLSDADVVVHYNGIKFDIPTLNREFIVHNLTPPPPAKQVDLLNVVKNQFRFPSNKLEYVVKTLGVGNKVKTEGHELWVKCMQGQPLAWEQMKRYNIQDVILLEKLYDRLKPWIKSHPNHGLYSGGNDSMVCPTCGSTHLHRRGEARTPTNVFARYQCQSCGTWSRSPVSSTTREQRRSLMRQA